MAQGRGHRRVHSYFSGFTVSGAVETGQPIHKAVGLSSNNLHLKLQYTSHLSKSAQDVSAIVRETELKLDDEVQAVGRRSCRPTIPSFVKHSVKQHSQQTPIMARPRSPKSRNSGESNHRHMEDLLDQRLLAIRQQLNDLSNDRTKMELQMDDLINGIREARQQCHNQYRRRSSATRGLTPGSLRRMNSSSGTATQSVTPKPAKRLSSLESSNDRAVPVSSPPEGIGGSKMSTSITSQESIEDSPVFAHKGSLSDSLNSTYSTHSLPGFRSRRSQSTSSSVKDRVSSDSISEQSRSVSLSQDEWIHNSVIPELPESPRLSTPGTPVLHSKYNQSTPALHYQSLTAPRNSKNAQKTSTPNSVMPVHIMSSSPDISKKGLGKQDQYSYQSQSRSHRNSLPDSVMNSVILEDQVDSNNCYDSLSQLSSCTEEGSPKNRGSTLILRRSSLTGQLEHIRRPRMLVKRNSSFATSSSDQHAAERPRCESVCSLHDSSSGQNFKVLTRGYRKSTKRKPKKVHVILPSVETTV